MSNTPTCRPFPLSLQSGERAGRQLLHPHLATAWSDTVVAEGHRGHFCHWYTQGTTVTTIAQPRTLHDFGGFPQELSISVTRRLDRLR
ncbi:MAG: hypothetical protein GPOALKHO_001561 [Sodalis sp.]|nr:MAG: hypothetical protein GPOALKHO_001561 [Sodalis sp.]